MSSRPHHPVGDSRWAWGIRSYDPLVEVQHSSMNDRRRHEDATVTCHEGRTAFKAY
jgi:hypothetical protein